MVRNISPPPEAEFSEKELNLFAKKYDEGYNLFDQRLNCGYKSTIPRTLWFVRHYLKRGLKVQQ